MQQRLMSSAILVAVALFPMVSAAQDGSADTGATATVQEERAEETTVITTLPTYGVLFQTMADAVVGKPFVLDGTRSQDDGVVRKFTWTQVSGPVIFSTREGASISVVPSAAGTYVFELVVTDATGLASIAQRATVTVAAEERSGDGSAEAEGDTEAESPEAAMTAEGSVDGGNNDNWDFGGDATIRTSTAIVVKKVTVRGWDPEKKEEIVGRVSLRAEDVKDAAGLEDLAARVILEDENMESVTFEEEKVIVKYRVQGRLLWIIPIRFTQTVEVSEGASLVLVRMPWYSFLVAKDVPVQDVLSAVGEGLEAVKDVDSISIQARVFVTVSNVLKTKHDTAKNSVGNVR